MLCRNQLTTVLILAFVVMTSCQLMASDPGVPDTVYIGGGPLALSHSRPITISVTNDEAIAGWSLGFLIESIDGGFARFDSSRWVGRTSDPSIFGFRINRYWAGEPTPGTSPDIVVSGAGKEGLNSLPPGRGGVVELYFTGLALGHFAIDSVYFPPAGPFMLIIDGVPVSDFVPKFAGDTIEVIEASLPPAIYLPETEYRIVAGTNLEFEVNGVSNIGGALELSMLPFHYFDDVDHLPSSSPNVVGSNPLSFQWSPTTADVGIWSASFEACDTSGNCVTKSLGIQVVVDSKYLVAFNQSQIADAPFSTGIATGDADGDGTPEIAVSGNGNHSSPASVIYEVTTGPVLSEIHVDPIGNINYDAVGGLVNNDNLADFAMMAYVPLSTTNYQVRSLLSNGNNTFDQVLDSNDGHVTRSCVLTELTGDAHLDIASTWYDGIRIYAGNSQGAFVLSKFIPTADSALSANAGDFDNDGDQDLAIGTNLGLDIYLAIGNGEFQLSQFYPQINGSLDIEVTNRASDLNGDGQIDLCISTPSVGGERSQMINYYGHSDGSFAQVVLRDVRGQIFGNCFGDANNDGELDIIYVNGAEHYLGIAFGDSSQTFTNEIRVSTGEYSPRHVASLDADADGDLDIAVTAFKGTGTTNGSIVVLLENLTNPGGFQKTFWTIDARNSGGVALHTPSGRVVSSVRNTIPSAMFNERNANSDAKLDSYIRLSAVEQGIYVISARPQSGSNEGDLFTIEYGIGRINYRIAKDAPMSLQGFDFGVCAGSESSIYPRPGSFSSENPPYLSWPGLGQHDLQVATDPAFQNIIADTAVGSNFCQLADSIVIQDTISLFWRVKPSGASEFGWIYALNLVLFNSECGDADASGMVNVSDVVFLINYIFAGGPAPVPIELSDVDCSGMINISDVVFLINYIFLGGPDPCSGC